MRVYLNLVRGSHINRLTIKQSVEITIDSKPGTGWLVLHEERYTKSGALLGGSFPTRPDIRDRVANAIDLILTSQGEFAKIEGMFIELDMGDDPNVR